MDIKIVSQGGQERPKPQKAKTGLSALFDASFSEDEVIDLAGRDEYSEWCKLERERQADNPIVHV
jgi:hypothetical protein